MTPINRDTLSQASRQEYWREKTSSLLKWHSFTLEYMVALLLVGYKAEVVMPDSLIIQSERLSSAWSHKFELPSPWVLWIVPSIVVSLLKKFNEVILPLSFSTCALSQTSFKVQHRHYLYFVCYYTQITINFFL